MTRSLVTPAWFTEALGVEPKPHTVDVDGYEIAVRTWGDPSAPGVVLVHGGAAHSRWWDHIAPFLARDHRVVALDLSGHGDSAHRDAYDLNSWADEVRAVTADAGFSGPPTLIGHSMGGWVSMTAAGSAGSAGVEFSGVAVLDTPLRSRSPEEMEAAGKRSFGPTKIYPTRLEALGRFRPVPDQPDSLPFVIEHVALSSLRETDGGWRWKFDPKIFGRAKVEPDMLQNIRCRAAVFRSEFGLVTPDVAADMHRLLGRTAPVIEIPLAGHHVMLDYPLALVTGLRTLLADWEHSAPRKAS